MPVWNNERLDFEKCNHCGKSFKLSRPKSAGQVTLCNCKSSTPTSVDLNRFLSGFIPDRALQIYKIYCSAKTRKWRPKDSDTGSLQANIKRHGEALGIKKHKELAKKKVTTSIAYFLANGATPEEAIKLQRERQSVGAVEKYVLKYGLEEGVKRWAARNKKWSETMHAAKVKKECMIPNELSSERDRKLQYVYCIGILTNIAARMFSAMIPESEASKSAQIRHLDHQFSRSAAFHRRADLKIVAAPTNLKWLSKNENLAKKDICAFSYKEVQMRYNSWIQDKDARRYHDLCEALLSYWRDQGLQV